MEEVFALSESRGVKMLHDEIKFHSKLLIQQHNNMKSIFNFANHFVLVIYPNLTTSFVFS